MKRTKRVSSLIITLLVLLSACSPGQSTMSDSTYVNLMAELIAYKNAPGSDTAANALRRKEALEKFRVTEADLQKKTDVLSDDPIHFAEVWGKVRLKISPGG